MILNVGSRYSELAQNQAGNVVDLLEKQENVRAELKTMEAAGDKDTESDPGEFDETGVFTSRLDQKLLDGRFDLVIHSLKDCPTETPEQLEVAAIPPRATPFDVLIGSLESDLSNLPSGTVIGTSSIRRRANLLHLNSNISVESCRGNVPTRIDKLEDDDTKYDAIVLAAAGLERLELSPKGRMLRRPEMLPAPGQGALAVMCRADKPKIKEIVEAISHRPSEFICRAERSFLSRLEGGCQAPIGAIGRLRNGTLELTGSVLEPDGNRKLQDTISGSRDDAESLGKQLADRLLTDGAGSFLDR
ncbi:MAG: hydroxymethylbilane synthase [bacterium]